VYLDLLTPE